MKPACPIAVVLLAALVAGCGDGGQAANAARLTNQAAAAAPRVETPTPATAKTAQAGSPAEPAAATLPGLTPDALPGKEIAPERLYGRWIVDRVAADASAPAGFTPDEKLVGRVMRYDEKLLAWEAKDGSIDRADRCDDPMLSLVWTVANARTMARPFRPAWTALDIPLDRVGPPHNWECDTAEFTSFGPNAGIFFPIGDDRLILNWHDHNILLLRRAG